MLLVIMSAGCSLESVCTLAGCDSFLMLRFQSDTFSGTDYRLVLGDPEAPLLICDQVTGQPNCSEASPWSGLYFLDPQTLEVEVYVGAPPELMVTLTHEGDPLFSDIVRPDYESYFPNGSNCEPECHNALVEIPLP